jgi:hypothetical protein
MDRNDRLDDLEQLVRDSLQARAQDVEPTPALWQEVDRRIARRRRLRVGALALAGAAAVLAAIAVVPSLLPDDVERLPDIADQPPPSLPAGPAAAVARSDGSLETVDLVTGDAAVAPRPGTAGGGVTQVVVDPTSTRDQVRAVVVRVGPDQIEHEVVGPDTSRGTAQDGLAPTDGFGSTVLSPAGEHLATILPDPDAAPGTAPQGAVVIAPVAEPGRLWSPASSGVMVAPPGTQLLEWTGGVADVGDVSSLIVRLPGGTPQVQTLTRTAEGFDAVGAPFAWVALDEWLDPGDQVLDVASQRQVAGPEVVPDRALVLGADGDPYLHTFEPTDAGEPVTATRMGLTDLGVARSDPARLSLDARGAGVLVTDGRAAVFIVTDVDGNMVSSTRFPGDYVAGTLIGDVPAPELPPAPAPEPEPDDTPGGEAAPPPAAGGLPAPLVIADGPDLVLLGDDDPTSRTTLVTLPAEGESAFTSLAVRAGSTPTDLTVVSRTMAEGMVDLRFIHVEDGEVVVSFDAFDGPYAPTSTAAHVSDVVWSPDGTSLAWVEEVAGATTLRTIGWDATLPGPGTGLTATDNAAFELEVPSGLGLQPQAWVDAGADASTLLLATPEPVDGWWEVAITRQADGAWALEPGAERNVGLEGVPGAGNVVAVAPAGPDGSRWIMGLGEDGLVVWFAGTDSGRPIATLTDVFPGEGLPEVWATGLPDAVVVGGRGTGVAYLVSAADPTPVRLPPAIDGGFLTAR